MASQLDEMKKRLGTLKQYMHSRGMSTIMYCDAETYLLRGECVHAAAAKIAYNQVIRSSAYASGGLEARCFFDPHSLSWIVEVARAMKPSPLINGVLLA